MPASGLPAPTVDLVLRDLERVRAIALASAVLESLKLLPIVDGIVTAIEWVGLKTILPTVLAWRDLWRDGTLSFTTAFTAQFTESWPALLARTLPGISGGVALGLDVGTDVESALLPAPLDGFDVPPMLVDAAIAAVAHRAIQRHRRADPRPIAGAPALAPR